MKLVITADKELLNFNQIISITATKTPTGKYQIVANTMIYNYLLLTQQFDDISSAKSYILNNITQFIVSQIDSNLIDFRKIKI